MEKKIGKYGIMLPNIQPDIPESYLCTPIRLNNTTDYYVVGFEPKATKDKIHHMVLYGCLTPGQNSNLWTCGHLGKSAPRDLALVTHNPCKSGSTILYAWARNATTFQLPPGVGFRVGGSSAIQYFVLQYHYASPDKRSAYGDRTDTSGLFIHYTRKPVTKLAGLYILGTGGRVLPMSEERLESACMIMENKTIHPFAIRTHTHYLGTLASGYRVKTDKNRTNHWSLIGKLDPQTPHMFYPVANNITVTQGDILAARCSYYSNRTTVTKVGHADEDEACNFYIMYYVDEGEPLKEEHCWTEGAPDYYWDSELNNIPVDASTPETSG